jgi:uncharacterized membrane protein YesL
MPLHPYAERYPRLWAFLESLSAVIAGGLLFWLFSIGIVTIPAALVGLYACVGGVIRPQPGTAVGRFWGSFRRSFLTALLLGLLDLVLAGILYVDIRFFWAMGTPVWKALAVVMGSLGAVLLMINTFAWPLLAWYPQPVRQVLKRSFLLAAAHPLLAVAGAAAPVALLALLLLLPRQLSGLLPALGPGLATAATGAITWQAMKRYARTEDELVE